MFYGGGKVIDMTKGEDGVPTLNPEHVMIALFCIMFGASNAGTAAAFGPDMGKAAAAATRIFKIIEYPSSINAIE